MRRPDLRYINSSYASNLSIRDKASSSIEPRFTADTIWNSGHPPGTPDGKDAIVTTGRRRPLRKPKGKEGFCWAWKKGHKARGLAAEQARDRAKAKTHRCHKKPDTDTGRCYLHGGTAKSGKEHHSYKHGFYSRRHHGILARAREAHEALEAMVDRESKRQERQAATVNVNAFFGFVEMFTQQVNIHISDPAERAAIGKAFSDAVARAGLADLVNDGGREPTRH